MSIAAPRTPAPARRFALACLLAIGAIAGAGGPLPALAETPEERGLAIAREAERRSQGWIDLVGQARMVLRDRQGGTSDRRMEMRSLEGAPGTNDGGKSLLIFRSPPDVDGTMLLTHSHRSREDDQWIMLPEIKRVRRISSSGKSGAFVGSEFSYEDLRDSQVEKFQFKYLRDAPCESGNLTCFVLERIPKDPDSGYVRQIVYLDQAEYRTFKVEFYDRKNSLLKTLTFSDHRKQLDRFWRAHRGFMQNHQTGRSTEMLWLDYKYRQNLTARDFEHGSLEWQR